MSEIVNSLTSTDRIGSSGSVDTTRSGVAGGWSTSGPEFTAIDAM